MKHIFKGHIKNTLILAYPVAIGQLGQVLMGVVDSLFVGKLGTVPLAATSIATSIFFLILVLGLGFTYAISPLVAIAIGADRTDECEHILKHGLVINIIVSLLLVSITFAISYNIDCLNQPPDVARLAAVYLRIIGISIIPVMIFQTFRQFIEGMSIMIPGMLIAIAANIINAFGNWVLVFGKLGLPELGFEGSAMATLFTRTFMAAAIVVYLFSSHRFDKFNINFRMDKFLKPVASRIITMGTSSGFQYFFEVGAFSSAAVMIGWIGTPQLAAHQIALNLATIPYMAALGVSAASAIRVGSLLGSGDMKGARHAGFAAIIIGGAAELISGAVFILFRDALPALYISDTDVISITSTLLVIAAFFQISDGVQAVALGVLRGLTDVKIPTVITFVSYWILGLPAGYLLAFHFSLGVNGVWIGFIVGLTASAVLLTSRFWFRSR